MARGRKKKKLVSTGMQESAMSQEQVAALAKMNWKRTPKLHREFTSEAAYVAYCKADAAGRVRFLDKPKGKRTDLPEQKGDLLHEIAASAVDPGFLGLAATAADNALRVIAKAGLPSKLQELQSDERLRTPRHIFEAYELLEAREKLSSSLEPLISSPARAEILHIVSVALQVGWLVQRLRYWQDFPDIVSARRARSEGKRGSEKTHSREKREERERERRRWRAEYARLEEARPGMTRTSIARQVGRTFRVDERTILRYTSSPKKN